MESGKNIQLLYDVGLRIKELRLENELNLQKGLEWIGHRFRPTSVENGFRTYSFCAGLRMNLE